MPRKRSTTAPEAPTTKTSKNPATTGPTAPAKKPRATRKRRPTVSRTALAPEPAPTAAPDPNAGLTPADLEILALLEDPEYISVMERRARVARLRSRKLTMREIGVALGISAATVYRDLRAIDEDWRREATTDLAAIRARELAELRDMEYQAATASANSGSEEAKIRWLGERRQIKARIAALMGLDAPKAITAEVDLKEGGLTAQERRALAANIAAMHAAQQDEHDAGE